MWMVAVLLIASQPADKRIDLGEIQIEGTRPMPMVYFVDGGLESLRRSMRSLAAEAQRNPLAAPPQAPVKQSLVRVLKAEVQGAWDTLDVSRAKVLLVERAAYCRSPTGRVTISVELAGGRIQRASAVDDAARCTVGALRTARWPLGAAKLDVELGLTDLP